MDLTNVSKQAFESGVIFISGYYMLTHICIKTFCVLNTLTAWQTENTEKAKKIKAYHLAWHSWSIIILLLGLTIVVCQLIVLSAP